MFEFWPIYVIVVILGVLCGLFWSFIVVARAHDRNAFQHLLSELDDEHHEDSENQHTDINNHSDSSNYENQHTDINDHSDHSDSHYEDVHSDAHQHSDDAGSPHK